MGVWGDGPDVHSLSRDIPVTSDADVTNELLLVLVEIDSPLRASRLLRVLLLRAPSTLPPERGLGVLENIEDVYVEDFQVADDDE